MLSRGLGCALNGVGAEEDAVGRQLRRGSDCMQHTENRAGVRDPSRDLKATETEPGQWEMGRDRWRMHWVKPDRRLRARAEGRSRPESG